MNHLGYRCGHPPRLGTHEDSDWALIRRIGDGDSKAFERLYKRYYHYLFRFVYRITHRLELVEEIINDVMFVVWQKAGGLELKSRASTWILSIAYRKSLKSLYPSQRTSNDVPLEEIEHDLSSDETMIEQLELEDVLSVALGSLSPEQRSIIELVYFHEMHYNDIAEAIGCPENTVKTRMFHAHKKLRSLLPSLMEGTDCNQKQK